MFDTIYNILVVVGAITLVAVAAVVVTLIEHMRRDPDGSQAPPSDDTQQEP